MLISIIVPVYKVEQYLDRCVQSLINQTKKDIEIILVDDGSPDNCPEMCDHYAQIDKRIHVVHKENGGLSDARNAGLSVSCGEYVLFIDSDDWIEEDTCERFESFASSQADIYIGALKNTDGTRYSPISDAKVGEIYRGEEYYVRFHNSIISCAVASMYKRSFLESNHLSFIYGKHNEDIEFTPRAYIAADTIVYTDIVFYNRFVRDESITTSSDQRRNLKDLLDICIKLKNYGLKLKSSQTRRVLFNSICTSYLSQFSVTDIYRYTDDDYEKYISKELVRMTAVELKTRIKAYLFLISPRAYVYVWKKLKD